MSEQKTHLGTKMSKPINKTKLVCETVIVNRNEAFNHQKKKAVASTAISKTAQKKKIKKKKHSWDDQQYQEQELDGSICVPMLSVMV